jgi:hypothetical protein
LQLGLNDTHASAGALQKAITRPGRRRVLVPIQLFLFQRMQNRMERSERYVCRFGQDGGLFLDEVASVHFRTKRS